jgi:hypothetical protein
MFMRSDLIYGALTHISNRYQLCQLASKATRKLHKPNTRLQDTTNEVLVRFHEASPVGMIGENKVASEQVSQQLPEVPLLPSSILLQTSYRR